MTTAPQVLLFDVMDTLVYDPYATEQPAFFDLTAEKLFQQKHPTSWVEFEHGHIDETEYLSRYFQDGRSFDHEGLKACMRQAYRWLDGMEALLEELQQAGYRIYALSNYSVWYRMIEERLGLSRFLDWSFVSCHTGFRKPDPEAYLGPARELGVAPENCLFVDDREKNCRAANGVGMPAIHFSGALALRQELCRQRLLHLESGASQGCVTLPG